MPTKVIEVILTTDHGTVRVDSPVKVVGDKNTNTNLRYKLGKALNYNPKQVYEMKHPQRFGLPSPNVTTSYIYALGRDFSHIPIIIITTYNITRIRFSMAEYRWKRC